MNLKDFYALGSEDQQQYFGKTYFQIPSLDTGKLQWCSCIGFVDRNIAKFEFGAGEGVNAVNLATCSPNFEFPQSGLYNFGGSTLYYYRIPKRQSKKALCPETAMFRSFNRIFATPGGKSPVPPAQDTGRIWRVNSIREIFGEAHDFSLADAMTFFKKRRPLSFAIDRNFAISLGVKGKFLSLWYKQLLIGEVPSQKEILLYPSFFQQEALDRFIPEGIKISGVQT